MLGWRRRTIPIVFAAKRFGAGVVKGAAPTVFVVDGSREYRAALSFELSAAGYPVRSFESAERFLAVQDAKTPGCVLLEFSLPGMNGIELQRLLVGSPCARPIVFFTDKGDIHTGVQAMKAGAVDFLTKPIDDDRLIAAIEEAHRRDAEHRREHAIRGVIQRRLATLTRSERLVMKQVIRGRINKLIATDLGISEKTVKVHRGRVISKMDVCSIAELVQLCARVGVAIEPTLELDASVLNWKLVDYTNMLNESARRAVSVDHRIKSSKRIGQRVPVRSLSWSCI